MQSAHTCRRAKVTHISRAFSSDKELLDAALQMFNARTALGEARRPWSKVEDKRLLALVRNERRLTARWHRSLKMAGAGVFVSCKCKKHRLNRLECEILAALLLSQMTLLKIRNQTCGELIEAVGVPADKMIDALKCLTGYGGCLMKSGLAVCEDPDEAIQDRHIHVADDVFLMALIGKEQPNRGWPVRNEEELYNYMARLTVTFRDKHMAIERLFGGLHRAEVATADRKIARLIQGLRTTLLDHPEWKLGRFRDQLAGMGGEWTIFLALLGKELGHVDASDQLFLGKGLAHIVSSKEYEVAANLQRLTPNRKLISGEFIRPCGGTGETSSNAPADIAETEFELTSGVIEVLGLAKNGRKRKRGRYEARDPKVTMSQLVLAEETQRAINLAIVHAKYERTLTEKWGLAEVIPYGRSVTLLFAGPPGTGKTATAEALAHELGRPILVANYAEIQNCWVGQTEKNIVRAFNDAKSNNAVLFWDEADAMFFDRETAFRNWEVRDVNVLLQELERFEGVCILATNRKITLDKALERRITLKVEFERPDRAMRRQIWEKMLPKKMPLASDIDLDRLSEADLAGGEIKNVILNAARTALEEKDKGPVTMNHFLRAVEMETQGGWCEHGSRRAIGFASARPLSGEPDRRKAI